MKRQLYDMVEMGLVDKILNHVPIMDNIGNDRFSRLPFRTLAKTSEYQQLLSAGRDDKSINSALARRWRSRMVPVNPVLKGPLVETPLKSPPTITKPCPHCAGLFFDMLTDMQKRLLSQI